MDWPPVSRRTFKNAVLLLQSPVRAVIEDMMQYTGEKKDVVDLDAAWERYKSDSRAFKKLDKWVFHVL